MEWIYETTEPSYVVENSDSGRNNEQKIVYKIFYASIGKIWF